MSFIPTWRAELKTTAPDFAPLLKEDLSLNLLYGLCAGALLWVVRDIGVGENGQVRIAAAGVCKRQQMPAAVVPEYPKLGWGEQRLPLERRCETRYRVGPLIQWALKDEQLHSDAVQICATDAPAAGPAGAQAVRRWGAWRVLPAGANFPVLRHAHHIGLALPHSLLEQRLRADWL
jgi:hypothetical protein